MSKTYPQIPLVDGDVIAYRSACTVPVEEPKEYALHNAKLQMEKFVDLFDRGLEMRVFLTGEGNYRDKVATIQPYKGNRKDAVKPPYLADVREYLAYAWRAELVNGREADDALGCTQYAAKDKSTCIVTVDKDLDGIPGWHYNPVKDTHYYVTLEEANIFFYTQLLTGDRVDNIRGCDGIGIKKAQKLLANLTTELQLYNACRAAYTGKYGMDGDRFLEENAKLLWIQRKEGESWIRPC